MQKFTNIYGSLPQVVEQQLEFAKNSMEHPIFHPERVLYEHIRIVVDRTLETDAIELHFAGLLHDITKSGFCPALWGENHDRVGTYNAKLDYWRNAEHDKQAVQFIELPSVTEWIRSCGVNDAQMADIKSLCLNHMHTKQNIHRYQKIAHNAVIRPFKGIYNGVSSEARYLSMALFFSSYCDNMRV